jgi:serine/threonine protein kinase/Tol biopolymer transport system component
MLAPGSTLGPYEVVAPLGSGGMGEVYRAYDTRLGRDVAIKVLPAELAADLEGRARLEREARAVASLSHPHICTLHDIAEAAPPAPGEEPSRPIPFLVMELLEGETVAERLIKGPMPLADVLRVGAQIADALDRAHRHGLIHRDLKPGNIMLVQSGAGRQRAVYAKLLDFGLAKTVSASTGVAGYGPAVGITTGPDEPGPGGSGARTRMAEVPITSHGAIVGTFPYMSPEQIEGRQVDARTDVWSLGVTLYEMATAARAFNGASAASVMSAVLRDEPKPMTELVTLAPPSFERTVRQCLAKDPDDRWQSAGDLKRELEWLASGGGASADAIRASGAETPALASPGASRGLMKWLTALAGAVALAVAAAAAGFWIGRSDAPHAEAWTAFTQLTDAAGEETAPSLSPDGTSFAYARRAGGSWDIHVQRVGGRTAIPVADDPDRDENWPAFSPDGQRIAFSESDDDGGIFIVGSTGESVNRLTDFGFNPTWSPDGSRIAFATEEVSSPYIRNSVSELWVVDVAGGPPRKLTDGDAVQPAWSPSGARIAFWRNHGGQRDLATIPAGGGTPLALVDDAPLDWSPVWAPDGEFIYFSSDRGGSMALWRIPIDEATGLAPGEPEPIAAGAEASMALPSFSANGTTILFRSQILSTNPVAIPFDQAADRAGVPRDLLGGTGIFAPTSVSPDGQWIALGNIGARQEDIFLLRADGSELRRLTDDLARDRIPRFTPDGSALTFYSNRDGSTYGAWMIRTDGSGLTRLSDPTVPDVNYVMLEPGGDRLVVTKTGPNETYIVQPPWPFSLANVPPLRGLDLGGGVLNPNVWSPDGRRLSGPIVPMSGTPLGFGVYDVAAGTARQVSADGGVWEAAWLPDSRRLTYVTESGDLVVVDTSSGQRRVVLGGLLPPDLDGVAMSPDGRTFYYGARRVESNIWKVERR